MKNIYITGNGLPESRLKGFMRTLQDRIRIPWQGGARQVHLDVVLPIVIVPTALLLASIDIWWTVSMFSTMFLILLYNFFCSPCTFYKTHFFVSWAVTSLTLQFLLFEFLVIPQLEIFPHENIAVVVLIVLFMNCLYVIKFRSCKYTGESLELGEREEGERTYKCLICQTFVPEWNHHCVWLNCCIGFHNRFLFLVANGLVIGALLYSSNLTLTTVCHPFHIYKTILLPDDCSDVYSQFEFSLSFVSGVYSFLIACVLGIFFIYDIFLISIGLTHHEWQSLPVSAKLCFGCTARRPYNKGFFYNWFHIITSRYRRVACTY